MKYLIKALVFVVAFLAGLAGYKDISLKLIALDAGQTHLADPSGDNSGSGPSWGA